MRKWKWLLIISAVTALLAWYFLFYKTVSKLNIAGNADMVFAIDVKRNVKDILYYYITTPKEWSFGSIFSSSKKSDKPDWKDVVKMPDYIFLFHTKGQPSEALYCRFTIKDETVFLKLLTAYGFKERLKSSEQTEYYADQLGIDVIKKGDQLLIGNLAVKDKLLLREVANDLFNKKQFINDTQLAKLTKPSNHFTLFVQKGNFLKEDLIVNGQLKDGLLRVDAVMEPNSRFLFNDATFDLPSESLMSFAITQPLPAVYGLMPDSLKTKISKVLNFNIDSVFTKWNNKYLLDVTAIKTRIDSAVSYSYDDDFNKVEKVIVNEVQEPAFNFLLSGTNPPLVFDYWKRNKNFEVNDTGYLFIPIPFVKTYASLAGNDALVLTAANYNNIKPTQKVTCIGNLCFLPDRLPKNAVNYLPDYLIPFLKNISAITMNAAKQGSGVKIEMSIKAINKSKPFLLCFE